MKNKTLIILTAILMALLFSISGFILVLTGGSAAVQGHIPAMHGAALSAFSGIDVSNIPAGSLGSCCICIPIPLGLALFALHQRAKS